MKIMKFGGTSVGSGSRMLHVAQIIKKHAQHESIVVVVSAMCGVTDKLISIFQKYKLQKLLEAREELSVLYLSHLTAIKDLHLSRKKKDKTERIINDLFGQLIAYLTFHKELSASCYDYVISFGERFSVVILNAALQKLGIRSKIFDSKDLIVTTNDFGGSLVFLDETKAKVEEILYPSIINGFVPIIPGFYGATKEGKIATLGRGGSDYTAAILAYMLDAQEVILWKEVDGVYTNDPKNSHEAKFLPELSYNDALKLVQNGAKVIHPEALKPVAEKAILVWVKNTFNPEFVGTKIWKGV